MIALALALAIAAAPPPTPSGGPSKATGLVVSVESPTAAPDEEDRWVLLEARRWMARVGLSGGDGWDGDVAAGIRDAAPLPPADPLIRELEPLLRTVASEAPRGLAPPPNPGQLPDPSWKLAWLDVDGDGRREIVLAGGTSPAPFFAVLQQTATEGRASWRLLHLAPFRFLGAATHSGHLFLFGGFDGYGVAGPALAVDRIESGGTGPSSSVRLLFDLPGWEASRLATAATVDGCTTSRRTKLRTEPRRDDAPRDLGLGASFPGNLLRTLEKGSTGWSLDSVKGPDGRPWTLCLFLGPSPMASEHPEREMLRPLKSTRAPLTQGGQVLVGWVPTADLVRR